MQLTNTDYNILYPYAKKYIELNQNKSPINKILLESNNPIAKKEIIKKFFQESLENIEKVQKYADEKYEELLKNLSKEQFSEIQKVNKLRLILLNKITNIIKNKNDQSNILKNISSSKVVFQLMIIFIYKINQNIENYFKNDLNKIKQIFIFLNNKNKNNMRESNKLKEKVFGDNGALTIPTVFTSIMLTTLTGISNDILKLFGIINPTLLLTIIVSIFAIYLSYGILSILISIINKPIKYIVSGLMKIIVFIVSKVSELINNKSKVKQ